MIITALYTAGFGLILVALACLFAGRLDLYFLIGMAVVVCFACAAVLTGLWYLMPVHATLFAVMYFMWRSLRRRRKRAPRHYGYKAKARIAKLVQKGRDTLRRRPGLRPVPGGTW